MKRRIILIGLIAAGYVVGSLLAPISAVLLLFICGFLVLIISTFIQ